MMLMLDVCSASNSNIRTYALYSENLGVAMEGLSPYGLSVHPDGQRIAFTAGTRRED